MEILLLWFSSHHKNLEQFTDLGVINFTFVVLSSKQIKNSWLCSFLMAVMGEPSHLRCSFHSRWFLLVSSLLIQFFSYVVLHFLKFLFLLYLFTWQNFPHFLCRFSWPFQLTYSLSSLIFCINKLSLLKCLLRCILLFWILLWSIWSLREHKKCTVYKTAIGSSLYQSKRQNYRCISYSIELEIGKELSFKGIFAFSFLFFLGLFFLDNWFDQVHKCRWYYP